jgi:hypothetical protein
MARSLSRVVLALALLAAPVSAQRAPISQQLVLFPAVIPLQYAGVYALNAGAVARRAAEGWLKAQVCSARTNEILDLARRGGMFTPKVLE